MTFQPQHLQYIGKVQALQEESGCSEMNPYDIQQDFGVNIGYVSLHLFRLPKTFPSFQFIRERLWKASFCSQCNKFATSSLTITDGMRPRRP